MQYQYTIFCPQQASKAQDQSQGVDRSQLFDAYSCVLFDSLRRLNARARPLKPLRCGLVLAFDTDKPCSDVEARVGQIVGKWNSRLRGFALEARLEGHPKLAAC